MIRKFVEAATAELVTEIDWPGEIKVGSILRLTDLDTKRQLDWTATSVRGDLVEVEPVFVTQYAADRLASAFQALLDDDESTAAERLRDIVNSMRAGARGGYFSDAMRMAGIEQGQRIEG